MLPISAKLWQIKPVLPRAIASGTEPKLIAITGVPVAIDSIITKPKGSCQEWETELLSHCLKVQSVRHR
jgi:hypothetical protein